MSNGILYLGDTTLQSAAAYLAGLIHQRGWSLEYVPSEVAVSADQISADTALFILSDYPAHQMERSLQAELVDRVAAGAGLLMIGGWESFHGCGGDWQKTRVADVLPVTIGDSDDRVNCDQPALVLMCRDHAITAGLPWNERPPCIGGFNRFAAKDDALTILETQRFSVSRTEDRFGFAPADRTPLLVVGQHGQGRVAALATDAAPHWVGGLVDWGTARVAAQAPGAEAVEVGDCYARFFWQLLQWTGNLDSRNHK